MGKRWARTIRKKTGEKSTPKAAERNGRRAGIPVHQRPTTKRFHTATKTRS